MISKLFTLLAFLILLLAPAPAFAAGQASLSLSPTSNTYNKGCSFSLDINLNTDSADTDGTDVILNYDSSLLTAVSITPGAAYPDYPSKNINASNGTISITGLASPERPFNGSAKFATVNFSVSSSANSGSTQVKFAFDPNNVNNPKDSNVVQTGQVVDILRTVNNGTYSIGTGNCSGSGTGTVNNTTGGTTGSTGNAGTGTVTYGPNGQVIYSQGGTTTTAGGTTLPQAGISTPTLILAISGTILVIAGILGLALL